MAAVTKTVNSTNVEESELRRGPWTIEEDTLLIQFIALHGEGQWNILAKQAGLKRTGKSCRLRWLNYLKPDVKRGNLTFQEQLLILELHSKWGNRWSKIAQQLPGRTDNEIKNYWRTRVQKQARQLRIESNSKRFFDAIRHLSIPTELQHHQAMEDHQSSYSSNSSSQNINFLNPSETLHLQSNPSLSTLQPSSSTSDHGTETHQWPEIQEHPERSSDEIDNSLQKTTHLVINGAYQMETCSYEMMVGLNQNPFSALGTWETAEFDCQMAANDWLLEDSIVENLWDLDKMV